VENNKIFAVVDFHATRTEGHLWLKVNPEIQFGRVGKLGQLEDAEYSPTNFSRKEVVDLLKVMRAVENFTGIVEREGLDALRNQNYIRPSQDCTHAANLERQQLRAVERLARQRKDGRGGTQLG
jgi:hypothetical protein